MAQVKDSQFYRQRVCEPPAGTSGPLEGEGAHCPVGSGLGPSAQAGQGATGRPGVPQSSALGYDARMGSCLQRARESLGHAMPSKAQVVAILILMGVCVVLGMVAFGGLGRHEVLIERQTASPSLEGAASMDAGDEAGVASTGEAATSQDASSAQDIQAYICVYVTGEVQVPAVYDLPEGSRVADAVEAAGGATAQANLEAINLAKPLSDAEMVHVPSLDDENVTYTAQSEIVSESGGLVNVNTAGVDELKTLNGIGDSLAQAIVEERENNGPFSSVEDLVRVSGIGAKTLARFSDKACV